MDAREIGIDPSSELKRETNFLHSMDQQTMTFKGALKAAINRTLSPQVFDHLARLKDEIYVSIIHRRGCATARRYRNQKGLKINFGCGSHLKEGFLNVDLTEEADLKLDLRQEIPLAAQSASLIFSEHFLEHLKYPEEAYQFVHECYRILEPGGKIYVTVPDTEWALEEYVNDKEEYLRICEEQGWHPEECTTFMEHINYHFRQRWTGINDADFDRHRFAYDFETLKKVLEKSGFADVKERAFNPDLDSPHRQAGGLRCEATKP